MNIAQIEANVRSLVDGLANGTCSHDNFIYELLLAYGHRKTGVTLLRKGDRNIAKEEDEVIFKRHLYYKQLEGEGLHAEIDRLKNQKLVKTNRLRFIIVTNFDSFLAIDTKTSDTLDISLSALPKKFDFFLPWAGMEKAVYQGENPADVKAAEKMAQLFDLIRVDNFDERNQNNTTILHNLNLFLTRLLFCYFAEDTNIYGNNEFSNVIKSHTKEDGSDLAEYINRLFLVLNTPTTSRVELPEYLSNFPYVNGGLFEENIRPPNFSRKSRRLLIECGSELDWSDINPDIFGSMMQAVVHPDQRGGMGMHYTSVINIMKVIEPLFLNDLYDDLDKASSSSKKLKSLQQRLSGLKIFDPACGSGNFLIIAYKELRIFEIELLKRQQELEIEKTGQIFQPFSVIKLSQFYGIELDDFAHEVAILSLWLGEHQMNQEFKAEFGEVLPSLPLKKGGNIICANATRIDWEEFCRSKDFEVYICGNPPYLGQKMQSPQQKKDLALTFHGIKNYKTLDYISCWFLKASKYISQNSRFAFVTTNSICQGTQVGLLWPHVLTGNNEIFFAHGSFPWTNSARSKAGVTCVIVGVRKKSGGTKLIFKDSLVRKAQNISPYLVEGEDIIVHKSRTSLSNLPKMVYGNMALDGGHLLLTDQEKGEFIEIDSRSGMYIKPTTGSKEFINGINRWCLWIEDSEYDDAYSIEPIRQRIDLCRSFRENGGDVAKTLADRPHQFRYRHRAKQAQILVPLVSSERRDFIPIGFVDKDVVVQQTAQVIYDPDTYIFSILNTSMHMAWVKRICGRMRTDIAYSNVLCYNTFPVPNLSKSEKLELENHAVNILSVREAFPERTLAELYDPNKMPQELIMAHASLDEYFDKLYRISQKASEEERLSHLLMLYKGLTGGLIA